MYGNRTFSKYLTGSYCNAYIPEHACIMELGIEHCVFVLKVLCLSAQGNTFCTRHVVFIHSVVCFSFQHINLKSVRLGMHPPDKLHLPGSPASTRWPQLQGAILKAESELIENTSQTVSNMLTRHNSFGSSFKQSGVCSRTKLDEDVLQGQSV